MDSHISWTPQSKYIVMVTNNSNILKKLFANTVIAFYETKDSHIFISKKEEEIDKYKDKSLHI